MELIPWFNYILYEGKIDFGGDGIVEKNGNNNQIYLEREKSGGQIGIYKALWINFRYKWWFKCIHSYCAVET